MFASPSLPSSTRAAIFSATWGVSIAYLVLMSTALAGLQLPALGMKGLVLAVAALILVKYAKAHPDQAEVKAALRINKLQAVVVLTEVLALGAALLGGASAQGVSQRGAALAGMVLLASVVVHLVIGVRGTRQLNQLRQAATAQETVAPAEPVSAAGTGVNDAQPPV